jgi:hypothetical protein
MHLSPVNEVHLYNLDDYEQESFAPVIEESEYLHQEITTFFKASGNIDAEITDVANKGNYNLLLIGMGQSIYEGTLLGKILGFTTRFINPERLIDQVAGRESLFDDSLFDDHTRFILLRCNIPIGVFIDKGLTNMARVFVPILSDTDDWIFLYLQKLVNNAGSLISVADAMQTFTKIESSVIKKHVEANSKNSQIRFITTSNIEKEFLQQQQLMMISAESWKSLVDLNPSWLADIPSTLILSAGEKPSVKFNANTSS